MAFPDGWPPRVATGQRNIRFYMVVNPTSANFADNAFLFADQATANPYTPLPFVRPGDDVSNPHYSGPHNIGANPAGTGQLDKDAPHPMIWSERIHITNTGGNDIEISFDGTNVHGVIPAGTTREYEDRREAGIALRSPGGASSARVEAW
jgi:hypothetical protein